MNWFKLLGERLGLWRCCWLEDFDGSMNLRIAHRMAFGRYRATSIISSVIWFPDGSIKGPSYVHAWHWNRDPKQKEIETLERMMRP